MIWREWHVILLLIQTESQPRSYSRIRPGLLASRLSRLSLRRHCSKCLPFHRAVPQGTRVDGETYDCTNFNFGLGLGISFDGVCYIYFTFLFSSHRHMHLLSSWRRFVAQIKESASEILVMSCNQNHEAGIESCLLGTQVLVSQTELHHRIFSPGVVSYVTSYYGTSSHGTSSYGTSSSRYPPTLPWDTPLWDTFL